MNTMKITLITGAIKNAGDFLIAKRAEELLKYVMIDNNIPIEIFSIVGNNKIDEKTLELVNKTDLIVVGGGPTYNKKIYPKIFPLVDDISKIKPKIFILGSGWREKTANKVDISKFRFSKKTKILLDRIKKDGYKFGCRDCYSIEVLNNNGYINNVLVGCPAWYDIKKIKKRFEEKKEIRNIAISDPSEDILFGNQSIKLIDILKKQFPKSKITYVFHRGISKKIEKHLIEKAINYVDISNSVDGFSIYNNCDIHIGYRVHAHIYCLSQRIRTLLIEEDSRGAGVNETLGLMHITAYRKNINSDQYRILKLCCKYTKLNFVNNSKFGDEIHDALKYIDENQLNYYNNTFEIMEKTFKSMVNHIEEIIEN